MSIEAKQKEKANNRRGASELQRLVSLPQGECRHIIPISGKDSCATAVVQVAHKPDRNYEYILNDVGSELPETYQWLDEVEEALDIEITRIGKSLLDLIEHYDILPAHRTRFCTREGKIEPMEKYIGKDEAAIVYYGLRADEPERTGYQNKGKSKIVAEHPLRKLGMGIKTVWKLLEDRDLLPPSFYWPELHERVERKVGHRDIQQRLKPWVFRQLFAGRSRTNCYHCFYQRQYEWIWLSKTHADLFDKAVEIEQETGGEDFTWNQGYGLLELAERSENVIDKRADAVAKMVSRIYQHDLFDKPVVEQTLMDTTNCGMFCGK